MNFLNAPGFLGSRASIMMDIVFLAMFAIVPVLAWSVYLVKVKKRYLLHKRVQLLLGTILGATVLLFEIHVRLHGWRHRMGESVPPMVIWIVLITHLAICIPTTFLWIAVIVQALRKIPNPPGPSPYSKQHAFLGKLAALGMFFTAVTGTLFYVLAFVL